MWILEHFSHHSHGFYTFFCAGKVFPSMDGDILPVEEGKLPGIVFSHRYFRKIPAFRVSQGHFRKIPAFLREECSRRPPPPWFIL
jgi:hypothetical protein